jgi:hypothetical protein
MEILALSEGASTVEISKAYHHYSERAEGDRQRESIDCLENRE